MELYFFPHSAPCQAALLIMHALGLSPDIKDVNIMAGEHLTPEYLQLNPQHTVPVLVDDGFVLSESRPIMMYLAEKYGNNTLYPSDVKARAIINQRLFFDVSTLYDRFLRAYIYVIIGKSKEIDKGIVKTLEDALGFLEAFMGDSPWMAGDAISVADYSIAVTMAQIEAVGTDLSKYPKISTWFEKCKTEMKDFEEIVLMPAAQAATMLEQHSPEPSELA